MSKGTGPVLKIKDAMDFYNKNRSSSMPELMEKDLAKILFSNAAPKTQVVNMSNLSRGKHKTVNPVWVTQICEHLGVDANFLFGIEPMDKKKRDQFYKNKQ